MAEKKFNLKLYGILTIIIVAAALVVLTVTTYVTRYNAFDPEKIAGVYVSTIVETGDGYNAFKNSLLSKNSKFGDFIRVNYIYPEIYENYETGGKTKGLKGLDDESLKGEKTLNDDGSLEGRLIDTMYPFFVNLIESNNGWDNYDTIFRAYVSELKKQRAAVFGDTFFDDETFFTCIEANISAYGDSLTGTEDVIDENTGVQTSFKSTGIYEEKYGEGYKFTVETAGIKDGEITADAAKYGIDAGAIAEEKTVTVQVKCNGEVVADGIEVKVVKIGHSWFVDNLATDTSALYNFYK